jgi:hypothetical protein
MRPGLTWPVVWKALTTKEVVTPELVVIETGDTENEVVAVIASLLVAMRVTDPVKPLAGVMVKVIPVEVPPGATETAVADPVHGPKEKSGFFAETMSTDASDPFG